MDMRRDINTRVPATLGRFLAYESMALEDGRQTGTLFRAVSSVDLALVHVWLDGRWTFAAWCPAQLRERPQRWLNVVAAACWLAFDGCGQTVWRYLVRLPTIRAAVTYTPAPPRHACGIYLPFPPPARRRTGRCRCLRERRAGSFLLGIRSAIEPW
jgi:hypothetical protein